MKFLKKSTAILSATALYLFTSFQVFAQNDIVPGDVPLVDPGPVATVNTVVRWIIIILIAIGIIAALIFLLWGAIKWIISGGDKEKVSEARGHIIAAIIGLVVLLLAVVILNFVMGLLGAGDILNPNIPTLECYLNLREGQALSECENARLSGQ